MGKKKTVTTVEEMVPGDGPESSAVEVEQQSYIQGGPSGLIPEPAEEELQKFFQDLGDNIQVKVYKYDTASNRPRFQCDTDIEGATESWLQEQFGEGRYTLRAYLDGVYKGGRTILIGPGIARNPVTGMERVPVAIPTTDPFLHLQMEKLQQDATDNRAIMLKLIDKLGEGNQKSSMMELVEALTMVKTLTPPAPPPVNPIQMITEALPLIKQFVAMMTGREPVEDTGWKGLIKDVISEVPNVMKNIGMARAGIVQENPPAAAQLPGVDPKIMDIMRQGIGFLKTRAVKQADSMIFVDYVMSTLDTDQSMQLASLIDRPYEDIAQLDPELLNPVYRPWFTKFFSELKDALAELQQPYNTSGEGGDPGNLASDEGTGITIISEGSTDPG